MQTRTFQTETRRLLQILSRSVYSHADVFLRELISNASDALDRLRLEGAVADDPCIRLAVDPDARTLTITDNGIGMNRDEVVRLIGTVARSGTAEAAQGGGLIGQFGLGFYSCFMVADRVVLETRRDGETTRFTWSGDSTYTVESCEDAPRGTSIRLHLRPDADYCSELKIREIVKQHSDFIAWPIRMHSEVVDGDVTLNSMRPLWTRNRADIEAHEYHEFYKHLTHDFDDPLKTIHFRVEGAFEFDALLFVPSHAPHDLFVREGRHGVSLYVRRVFVMDECRELLPGYLRWVRGVVDAHDLSMNISREALQNDRQVQLLRRALVRKVLAGLAELLTDDRAKYEQFWRECGQKFKEGLKKHPDDRATLIDLCLFETTHAHAGLSTLAEYVERMPAEQPAIYFINASSRAEAEQAPHLERLRARGVEVLLLTDPVDELWIVDLQAYRGRKLQSAARSGLDLEPTRVDGYEPLLVFMRDALSDHVKDVRLSTRLESSAACIVGDARDVSPQLEKMARATGQNLPRIRRVLEINPRHPAVQKLQARHAAAPEDPRLRPTAEMLYVTAVLAEGGGLVDPAHFARSLSLLLEHVL